MLRYTTAALDSAKKIGIQASERGSERSATATIARIAGAASHAAPTPNSWMNSLWTVTGSTIPTWTDATSSTHAGHHVGNASHGIAIATAPATTAANTNRRPPRGSAARGHSAR